MDASIARYDRDVNSYLTLATELIGQGRAAAQVQAEFSAQLLRDVYHRLPYPDDMRPTSPAPTMSGATRGDPVHHRRRSDERWARLSQERGYQRGPARAETASVRAAPALVVEWENLRETRTLTGGLPGGET